MSSGYQLPGQDTSCVHWWKPEALCGNAATVSLAGNFDHTQFDSLGPDCIKHSLMR